MLLVFDIGNSNVVFGVFKDNELLENWRMDTDSLKSADEYGLMVDSLFTLSKIKREDIKDIIISTVVPSVLFTFRHMANKYFNIEPLVVEPGIKTGLTIKYNDPAMVGADRIVNAVSVLSSYESPAVIIDLGTATTFCAVTEKWEYLGGTIAPGIKISLDALFEKTAKLPKVEIAIPKKTICKNTDESIRAGLVLGHASMIDGIVRKMKKELSDKTDAPIKVIATGGLATLIKEVSDEIDIVDRFLTLKGLNYIYLKNKKS